MGPGWGTALGALSSGVSLFLCITGRDVVRWFKFNWSTDGGNGGGKAWGGRSEGA